MQRSPTAMLLRLTSVNLPECDCHLPTMESAGRRTVTPSVLQRYMKRLSLLSMLEKIRSIDIATRSNRYILQQFSKQSESDHFLRSNSVAASSFIHLTYRDRFPVGHASSEKLNWMKSVFKRELFYQRDQ
jgi:hypothetical protein